MLTLKDQRGIKRGCYDWVDRLEIGKETRTSGAEQMANVYSYASHYFDAEAYALSGKLNLPFEEQIKKQSFVKLQGDSNKLLLEGELRKLKKVPENYLSQHATNYRLENFISYSAADTQVSGHRSKMNPNALVTFSTSSVENLNVLNVVTADRVVAQISTTHFPGHCSPEVTFLGTHFENLRIAHHKTVPILNLAVAGKSPQGRDAYYPTAATRETGLMASVERQYRKLRDDLKEVREKLQGEYLQRLEDNDSWFSRQYRGFSDFNYEDLQCSAKYAAEAAERDAKWEGVTCSLVEHVEIEDITIAKDSKPIVIHPPAYCFGHVIHVPDFGTIFLSELKVNHNSFHLTMIRLELGCIADGTISIATCYVNGQ